MTISSLRRLLELEESAAARESVFVFFNFGATNESRSYFLQKRLEVAFHLFSNKHTCMLACTHV